MAKKFVPNNNDFAIAYYRFSSVEGRRAELPLQRPQDPGLCGRACDGVRQGQTAV